MAKKILIIEDEEALINNLRMSLEGEYEVLVATTGKDGFEKAQTEQPALILLDVMLPDMNGLEVLKNLKQDEKTDNIDVIVATNLGDQETISSIIEAGGKEYIVKSDWKIDDIVEKIGKIVGE